MADNKVTVEFEVTGNASKQLNNLATQSKKTEKTVESSFGGMTSAANVFIGTFAANVAVAGFQQLGRAASALFKTFVTDGVAAAQVQEDAINQLNTALRLNGEFTEEASQDLQDFASQLQATSRVGDEAVLSQLALAKAFGATNEQSKELIQAAVDLSAATGISLDSAVRNLGKTFGGLVGELGEIVPELKNLSKEALGSGAAIQFILDKFGGAAQAQVATFSGAIEQANNTFGDLQESFGFIITSNAALIAIINDSAKGLQSFAKTIDENREELTKFVTDGIIVAIEGLKLLVQVFDVVARAATVSFNILQNSFLSIKAVILGLRSIIDDDFRKPFNQALMDIAQNSKEAADAFTNETGIAGALPILDALQEKVVIAGQASEDSAAKIVDANNKVKESTEALALTEEERLEAFRVAKEEELLVVIDFEAAKIAIEEETQAKRDELILKQIGLIEQRNERLKQIDQTANAAEIAANEKRIDTLIKKEGEFSLASEKFAARRAEVDRQRQQERLQLTSSFFGNLSSLTRSGNKDLFAIGKAAATAQAIVDGALAVQKALASAPPPFNFALAAAVGVKTAVQVSTINAQQLQAGIDSVPGTGTRDNFPAILAPGERVVPATTNQDLTRFLEQSTGQSEILADIRDALRNQQAPIINIGGETITEVVREQVESGRILLDSEAG